jgi:hypothetical protein
MLPLHRINKSRFYKMTQNKMTIRLLSEATSITQIPSSLIQEKEERKEEKPYVCRNCVHYEKNDSKHQCNRFQKFDLVNGNVNHDAADCRTDEDKCGKDGKEFVYGGFHEEKRVADESQVIVNIMVYYGLSLWAGVGIGSLLIGYVHSSVI